MKILITARELMDRAIWDEASNLLGINPYAVNEGRMDSSEELTLTEEQAQQLGILPKPTTERGW
jgi:hypothetical protein